MWQEIQFAAGNCVTPILSSNKGKIKSSSSSRERPNVVTDRYVEQEDYCGVGGLSAFTQAVSGVCLAPACYLFNKCAQTDIW